MVFMPWVYAGFREWLRVVSHRDAQDVAIVGDFASGLRENASSTMLLDERLPHPGRDKMKAIRKTLVTSLACCAGVLAIGLLVVAPINANSIPAWLDDAITEWNKANPASQIQFVDIKDAYVWYAMAARPELTSKEIRGRVFGIATKHGYAPSQDEEMVTTAKPPAPNGRATAKKCWTMNYQRDVQKGNSLSQERMLTTLVCEDGANWAAGFRVLQ
jgi:hypothetical protein